jgi:hypothetical protein
MTTPNRGADEVGALLRHTREWVRAECRAGRLPHHKVGQRYVFTDADIAEILAATAVSVRDDPPPMPARTGRRRLPTYSRTGNPTSRFVQVAQ